MVFPPPPWSPETNPTQEVFRAQNGSKTAQISVRNVEWGQEQSYFFTFFGHDQIQLTISSRTFLVRKMTTNFFIKKITFWSLD